MSGSGPLRCFLRKWRRMDIKGPDSYQIIPMESKPRKILTLCIIHQPPRVLLGMKKIGFGAGHWNGFGGKVEVGETIEQAARREVLEEAGIVVDDLIPIGTLDFEFL